MKNNRFKKLLEINGLTEEDVKSNANDDGVTITDLVEAINVLSMVVLESEEEDE